MEPEKIENVKVEKKNQKSAMLAKLLKKKR